MTMMNTIRFGMRLPDARRQQRLLIEALGAQGVLPAEMESGTMSDAVPAEVGRGRRASAPIPHSSLRALPARA
jgi:hypothetical protein